MNKKYLYLMTVIFFLIFFTSTAVMAASTGSDGTNPAENSIKTSLSEMKKAWADKDVETYLSYIAEDAQIMTGGRSRILVDKKTYGEKYLLKGMKKSPFEISKLKISSKNNEATVKFVMHPASSVYVYFTQTWMNNNGRWLLQKSKY